MTPTLKRSVVWIEVASAALLVACSSSPSNVVTPTLISDTGSSASDDQDLTSLSFLAEVKSEIDRDPTQAPVPDSNLSLTQTFEVSTTADSGPGSLRQAILDANQAPGADRITFLPGLQGTINLASPLPSITDDLDLQGPGAFQLAISGGTTVTIITIEQTATVQISRLTFADGSRGISNFGTLTLANSILLGNTQDQRGAALYSDNLATVSNSIITGNTAPLGAIYSREGSLTVENSLVIGNTGEGIRSNRGIVDDPTAGELNVSNSLIANNTDQGIVSSGSTTIASSIISGNLNSGLNFEGGSFLVSNYTETQVTIRDSTITGNTASNGTERSFVGGGIRTERPTTIINSTINFNRAEQGGGIFSDDSLTIRNSTISNNVASESGGGITQYGSTYFDFRGFRVVRILGPLTITDSQITGNSASTQGGGLSNLGGRVTLTRSTLSGNIANSQGGAIYNGINPPDAYGGIYFLELETVGTITSNGSQVQGNLAAAGGGIFNNGTLNLNFNTFSGNLINNIEGQRTGLRLGNTPSACNQSASC